MSTWIPGETRPMPGRASEAPDADLIGEEPTTAKGSCFLVAQNGAVGTARPCQAGRGGRKRTRQEAYRWEQVNVLHEQIKVYLRTVHNALDQEICASDIPYTDSYFQIKVRGTSRCPGP
jgi:hypothetical protein